jgi:hypothetical protein
VIPSGSHAFFNFIEERGDLVSKTYEALMATLCPPPRTDRINPRVGALTGAGTGAGVEAARGRGIPVSTDPDLVSKIAILSA